MITLSNVSKSIRGKEILKNINLEINKGDAIALVGPNGAGKSTLIDLLLGNKQVSSGKITGEIVKDHQRTSVLYQQTYFTPRMETKEIIDLFRSLYPNPLSLDEVMDITQFKASVLKTEAVKLSGGQKRILDVALTLIGRPEFIILDEATVGMDTSTRRRFYQLIQQLKDDGRTILFTSHYIEEVESLADRIVVLNKGEVIRDSTPRAIRAETAEKNIVIPLQYAPLVESLTEYNVTKQDEQFLYITTSQIDEMVAYFVNQNVSFQQVEISNESLLDRIFNVVEDDTHETV